MSAMQRSLLGFTLTLALLSGCSLVPTGENRVKDPIDATYEPLEGAAWNHRYSQELEELRAWQDAKKAFEEEYEPEPGTITKKSSVPEDRIIEPDPTVTSQNRQPVIEEDEDSIRIRE